ncbi:hypothetical protein BDV3_002282 [Batrachochytrium dendrobatidis]
MAQTIDLLLGKVVLVTFSVAKPAYELGAAAPLRFGKKNTTAPAVTKKVQYRSGSYSHDDDPIANQDLEDEDMLLDQDDFQFAIHKGKRLAKIAHVDVLEMEALDEASDMAGKIQLGGNLLKDDIQAL